MAGWMDGERPGWTGSDDDGDAMTNGVDCVETRMRCPSVRAGCGPYVRLGMGRILVSSYAFSVDPEFDACIVGRTLIMSVCLLFWMSVCTFGWMAEWMDWRG